MRVDNESAGKDDDGVLFAWRWALRVIGCALLLTGLSCWACGFISVYVAVKL